MITFAVDAFESFADPVARVLVHSLWQGGAIALLLGLLLLFIKDSNAKLRYALSVAGLALIVTTTLATGIYVGITEQVKHHAATELTTVGPIKAPLPKTEAEAVAQEKVKAAAASEHATTAATPQTQPYNLSRLIRWFAPVWVLGVLLMSLRHAVGWGRARSLTHRSAADLPEEWAATLKRLCREVKVSRPVRFATSTLVRVPCVVGYLKPVVLIPMATLTGLSTHDLELIIAHELAHIRRHDVLFGYIQAAAETILFFNPAVWWVSRQMRVEREHCCDDVACALSDRIRYVRALANLEEEREDHMEWVTAVTGAPLLHRARRLLGFEVERKTLPGAGVAGALILAAFLVLGSGITAEFTPADLVAAPYRYEPDGDDIDGTWEIESRDRGRVQLSMYFGRNFRTGTTIHISDLSVDLDEDTRSFKLERDAGTFYFEGQFETNRKGRLYGEGDVYFRANKDYVKDMSRFGPQIKSEKDAMVFAIHNVTLDYARGMADAGYDDLSFDKMLEAHIHDVTPDYIAELRRLGYRNLPIQRLIEMSIHDVEPEYIQKLGDLGYRDLSAEKLVEMSIHDVNPEFVEDLRKAGYDDLSADKLVEMHIHDVDPDFIRALRSAGYDNLSADKLIEMSIHDIDPDYIRDLRAAGYDNLSTDKLIEMSIHDIDPQFISDLRDAGYDNLSADKLIEMSIHDVDPAAIRALEKMGYRNLSADKLIEMSIHDIEPDYIEELADLGYKDLSPDKLVEMHIHDIDADYVQELAALGYKNLSPDKLIEMHIHDIDAAYVEELADAGLKNLSTDKLVEMHIHDIDGRFVSELAAAGYRNLSGDELVQMSIHDVDPDDIAEYAKLGYDDLSVDDLVSFQIHDVTPRFIQELAELGYDRLSPERLIEFQIHGVTASYIKRLAKRGVEGLSPDELVERKIHGW